MNLFYYATGKAYKFKYEVSKVITYIFTLVNFHEFGGEPINIFIIYRALLFFIIPQEQKSMY